MLKVLEHSTTSSKPFSAGKPLATKDLKRKGQGLVLRVFYPKLYSKPYPKPRAAHFVSLYRKLTVVSLIVNPGIMTAESSVSLIYRATQVQGRN